MMPREEFSADVGVLLSLQTVKCLSSEPYQLIAFEFFRTHNIVDDTSLTIYVKRKND